MEKIWLIAWKDVRLIFRDITALIFMLLAPFLLTMGMGLVTGRLSGGSGGPSGIQFIIVNQDEGELGVALVSLFRSEDFADLFVPELMDSPATARDKVNADQTTAAIIIPPDFTAGIYERPGESTVGQDAIEFYANPTRPTNTGIIKTIVDAFLTHVTIQAVQTQVTLQQLIEAGLVTPNQMTKVAQELSNQQSAAPATPSISVRTTGSEGTTLDFDILAYMAPGMAMMFLMYVVSRGGQSFLAERDAGTLARLRISPTTTSQVLGGKVLGIFLTGFAQMLILIVASSLLFNLYWGSPVAVLILVMASVTGAVGWGMIIMAVAKTAGQVGAVGSAIMLTFGILGGSFFQVNLMPSWFRIVRTITPNAWSIDGFTILARGGGLQDIAGVIVPLLVMGISLFAVAVYLLNRRGFVEA